MNKLQATKAHEVAKKAHFGQTDRAGIDYIKHPETVASFVTTDEEKAVAYLHDVIEDTTLTLLDLKKEGFSKNIIEAVDILTKKKGQDYQSYLNLVKTNELARVVKLADLRHNSDLTRLPLITEKDLERNKKYSSAITFLNT
ncbi:guanosine polyphosphate pyrophosphohydrolases/synthetases (COG0317) [Streptococcus pneumoniae]|mgnify:FL=1|uniref:Guanosine polyphosphate pyrophosphohydrolases/synthetases (COG0317) n=1 Tax=Streptococcus pneumoniae TaxID=1313 RepID=A0ABC9KED6_STREE|nr:HD domain-containing protein [Streptococcus pneumoniae]MDG8577749.1 HD domain-containing protein [Streptococcus pneumoniae]MDS8441582.1 HD domain-containing protein [Streptococcus pneumoniae]MDS8683720.1 HD domain-containing protein [Streptococcus pneumoniae]MDT5751569.1 HD domain-containing protein [Streptococcus pneumoniae]CEV78392.1 guanosine polyphosphate pyrophosphohydrolases/synthetases (COG0317) [Streptococcus pneumoniae]